MAVIPINFYDGTDANEKFIVPDATLVIVNGERGDDYIEATNADDQLTGGHGDDVILAFEGNDTIYGDTPENDKGGEDQILAGGGNDIVFAGLDHDYVNAGDGRDTVQGGLGNDYLVGGLGRDFVYGGGDNDILFGNGIDAGALQPLLLVIETDVDGITGNPITPDFHGADPGAMPLFDDNADDRLFGGGGDDAAFGGGGRDRLFGGRGDDRLAGQAGNDFLTGDLGADTFAFAEFGGANFDRITDFDRHDQIELEADVFTGLGNEGDRLDPALFHVGRKPHHPNDMVIYDKKHGLLYWDPDGDGKHFGMHKIAKLDPHTPLHAHDIILG